ncbi:MAG: histone deacetylase family protein [Lautropia sp.]|nr:histone deacetylase family protein [Lautropia sp.]
MRVVYLSHPSSTLHEMGRDHPERPDRVRVIADRLLSSGLLDLVESVEAPPATRAQLLRAHTGLHVDEMEARSPVSGYSRVDPDTVMNPKTLLAARHAAGAVVTATELVVSGRFQRAFCNVRPPGHHATREAAMGFCFFNNVVIGIRHALEELGVQRIALCDFDVHHGNGSEDILAGDDRVLMLSTFQSPLYPYCGEQPRGSNIISVPLAPYSNGEALRKAVSGFWLPALERFKPQVIFISAGFDAHRDDEISHLAWTDNDYAWVTRQVVSQADRHAGGRVVSVLEGGYDLLALARSVEQHVRELLEVGAEGLE